MSNLKSNLKWVRLLISFSFGDVSSCHHHPDRHAVQVVHENFRPLDLREFYKMYGEDEFPRSQQKVMRKTHPKQAVEKFVCQECLMIDYVNNTLRYGEPDDEVRQADFTSIEVSRWKKRNYRLVEDAVPDFLIKRKSN